MKVQTRAKNSTDTSLHGITLIPETISERDFLRVLQEDLVSSWKGFSLTGSNIFKMCKSPSPPVRTVNFMHVQKACITCFYREGRREEGKTVHKCTVEDETIEDAARSSCGTWEPNRAAIFRTRAKLGIDKTTGDDGPNFHLFGRGGFSIVRGE